MKDLDSQEEWILSYLAGELPPEEARAFENRLARDPELAVEVHLRQLEQRDLPRYPRGELELDLNGWLPGLDTLRASKTPLWLFSLLASTLVVGMAGMREPTRRRASQKNTAGSGHTDPAPDEAPPPGESAKAPARE